MTMSVRDTIYQSVSRSNRNTAILSLLAIIIAVAAFVLGSSKFALSYFGAPKTIDEDFLTTVDPAQKEFPDSLDAAALPLYKVQISGDEMFDSGMYETTTSTRNGVETGSSTSAYFGILTVGDHYLLVKTPGIIQEKVTDYQGVLLPYTTDEVGRDVYNDIIKEVPDAKDVLVPLMLDTGYDTMPWFLGLGVEGLFLLGGLFGLGTVMSRSNPNNHPILKRLSRFGDIESVMAEIDNEIMQAQPENVDKLQFTRSWVIFKNGNDMQFARISDVMWVYKHITQTRYGKNYATYVWDRSGQLLNVPGKEKNVDAMIVAVLQRAPWAIAGYNKDVESSWNKDRAGFIRTVDDRRTQAVQYH